jgi:hypothetical protein
MSTKKHSKSEKQPDLEKKERVDSLQWKKNIPKVDEVVKELIADIIYGEKWQADHMKDFSKERRDAYLKFMQIAIGSLAFDDRDRFINRIESVLTEQTKNHIWEAEHVDIENAIDTLTKENRRFAARVEVSEKTGYSVKTIDKHISEYRESSYYNKRQEDMLLMRERILSWCYKAAINGDMKAARLFLETSDDRHPHTVIKKQQNNYIQINQFKLSQETIQHLHQSN